MPIAAQVVIAPMKLDVTHLNRGVASTIDDAGTILNLAPGLSDPILTSDGEAFFAEIDTQAQLGNNLAMPRQKTLRRWISGYHDVTRIRSNKFISFDSPSATQPFTSDRIR